MIKTIFKISLLTLVISLSSCKNDANKFDYKFADKPAIVNCENVNSKLLNEAVYAFEEDILNNYTKNNPNLIRAYSVFMTSALGNRVKYETVVSEHTYKVFKALQKENSLWNLKGANSNINYNSPLIDCIANTINNPSIKTTFNALYSTNFLSPTLMGQPLRSKASLIAKDEALKTYIALEFYYAKLYEVDFSNIDFSKKETTPAKPANNNVNFNTPNKTTPKQKQQVKDEHAGHNHD
ncbi:hypothetical protein [Lacinutrix salivirga]